jgi:hypothetical protein
MSHFHGEYPDVRGKLRLEITADHSDFPPAYVQKLQGRTPFATAPDVGKADSLIQIGNSSLLPLIDSLPANCG